MGVANGIDLSPVLDQPPANKGYGNSTTTPCDVTDVDTAAMVLLALAETVGNRLRADNVQIEVVSVGIRYADLSYCSHQKVLQTSTNITWEKMDKTVDLLRKRFGMDSVMRAAFVNQPSCKPQIGHLSGGISMPKNTLAWEKRTVDYSKLKIE